MSPVNWGKVGAVVLAAGKGTRLNSQELPKAMRYIGGRPMVSYIVDTLKELKLGAKQICLVVGFKEERVREYFGGRVSYARQEELLGTAHAAYIGLKSLDAEFETVLVMGGDDSAFYRSGTLKNLVNRHWASGAVLTLLSAEIDRPAGLGRVVRSADGKAEIIEKEYLTKEQEKIKEISTGTFVFNRRWFEEIFPALPKLKKLNEYGLPSALALARETGQRCEILKLKNSREWFGVNTLEELQEADRRKKEER